MKKIFLHIGSPKTGSTAIQNSLQILHDKRILHNNEFDLIWKNLLSIIQLEKIKSNSTSKYENLFSYMLEHINNSQQSNIIISCESFFSSDSLLLDVLKNVFLGFEVKVLVYLRRQDFYAESSWAQHQRFLRASPRIHLVKPISYLSIINIYAKIFGKKNITVRIYDKEKLLNKDSVYDFLEWVGLQRYFELLSKSSHNPSLSPTNMRIRLSFMRQNIMTELQKVEMLKRLNKNVNHIKNFDLGGLQYSIAFAKNGINTNYEFVKILNNLLRLEATPKKNTHAYFSHEERKTILDECREENAAIAREYLGREDGVLFDESMPEELVSLDSPTTDDLVASFLPIFVHLTQRIDKLEKQYNDLVQEMHTQNIQQKEGNNTTTKQNNPQAEKTHQVQKDNNSLLTPSSPPINPSHLQCFKNILLQPLYKKKAFALCREKKFQEAEAIAQSFIVNNPNIAWAYYILAKVQCHQNNHTLALETIKKACSLENHPTYKKLLQKIQVKLNK